MGAATDNKLVTFGIGSTQRETGYGYGYIQYESQPGQASYPVLDFVEKPDLEIAKKYIAADNYLWNSGMFMFTSSQYLRELEQYQPEIATATKGCMQDTVTDLDFIRIDAGLFSSCPADLIDYAVMEKPVMPESYL